MITKGIVIVWTLFLFLIIYLSLGQVNGPIEIIHILGALFAFLFFWSVVVIPVSLVGMLFKRKSK